MRSAATLNIPADASKPACAPCWRAAPSLPCNPPSQRVHDQAQTTCWPARPPTWQRPMISSANPTGQSLQCDHYFFVKDTMCRVAALHFGGWAATASAGLDIHIARAAAAAECCLLGSCSRLFHEPRTLLPSIHTAMQRAAARRPGISDGKPAVTIADLPDTVLGRIFARLGDKG